MEDGCGKGDRSLELLAGNRVLGCHRDLEGPEHLWIVAAVGRYPRRWYHLFVVLPCQYLVFCYDRCHGVSFLAYPVTEALIGTIRSSRARSRAGRFMSI
jgi:hypothetical protein